MRDAVKLTELLERCEKAKEADRELDADVMAMCFPEWAKRGSPYLSPHCVGDESIYWHAPDWAYKRPVPKLTASIDAAVALVERVLPGSAWYKVYSDAATIYVPQDDENYQGDGATFPLAILSALLRALSTLDARAPSVKEGKHGQ